MIFPTGRSTISETGWHTWRWRVHVCGCALGSQWGLWKTRAELCHVVTVHPDGCRLEVSNVSFKVTDEFYDVKGKAFCYL